MCSQENSGPDVVQVQGSVEILENMGEWFVVVIRGGKEHVTSFEREAYANAYAEGQRLGMGLKKPVGEP